jgi:hypothetical protein
MTPLRTLIVDQIRALNELGDELQDWYDNSPEGLRNSDKMQVVLEAASNLSYLDEPEIPNWLEDLDFPDPHCKARVKTKADRLSYHCQLIRVIAETLNTTVHLDDELDAELSGFLSDLDTLVEDIEGLLS